MGQVTNGVAKIEIADVGQTNWRTLGYTNIDSASLVEEEGTTTDFNVEEIDTPIYTRFIPGKTTLAFQVADPVHQTYLEVFGGTITGSGPTAAWNAPAATVQKEFTVRITPMVGYVIFVERMVFKPRKNFSLGKNNLTMIDITADILQPANPSTPSIKLLAPVDANGSTGSLTSQTITFGSLGSKSISSDSPITLAATASSGLPITYLSTDPTKATVSGNVVTLLATGSVSIIATQMGNQVYAAATPVVQAMTVTA